MAGGAIRYPQSRIQWYRESAPTELYLGDTGARLMLAGMTVCVWSPVLEDEEPHSLRSTSVGFASTAFHTWPPTVARAMKVMDTIAIRKE